MTALKAGVAHPVSAASLGAVLTAPASLLPRGNHPSAAPAPRLCRAAGWPGAGHTHSRLRPAPQHARPADTPPLPSRGGPALHALSDWLCQRGAASALGTAPQRGCSFQTSTVSPGPRLRCRRREPPHGGQVSIAGRCTGEYKWVLPPRSCPAPQRAGAGERVLWRRPPAWGGTGAPSEGATAGEPAAAERSVPAPRATVVLRDWRVGSGTSPLSSGQRLPSVRAGASVEGSGCGRGYGPPRTPACWKWARTLQPLGWPHCCGALAASGRCPASPGLSGAAWGRSEVLQRPSQPGISPARVPLGPLRERLTRAPSAPGRRGPSRPFRGHSCAVRAGGARI